MAGQWSKYNNETFIDILEKELPQSTIYWLLISIFAAIAWIVYLTYYNSRAIGLVITLILNKFIKNAHVKFGSFSISLLSGKVMFRDVHYVTEDYALRIQDGYIIFRWWRPMPDADSHSDTRLTVYLDTVELHVYNRSSEYAKLERLFGLDEFMMPGSSKDDDLKSDSKGEETQLTGKAKQQTQKAERNIWRELIPVIKFEISSGKLVFGNYLLPSTLSMNFGDAHIMYTTKPASTPFDEFMYIIKCKADRVRVMLSPSPKYQGSVHDEPPRYMGDGFVVLQSSAVDIYYYQDEPGVVPYEPEQVQLANGDVIARRTWPCWGMDIKCGKGTDLSYGPWADRQREYLWKFFYPPDYQPLEPTEMPGPGQRRIIKSFDFKLSIQQEGTFDVLFTKDRETQAIHMNYAAGSYLEFTVPMVTEESGYVSKVNGQLMHLDATTSLPYRSFVECETFEFDVEAWYPRNWNEHQEWKCNLTMCKAWGSLIYHHKVFLLDLVEDWSTKTRPDIFHFYPYTWKLGVRLREFELSVIANEWNWIDCFGPTLENTQIAMCGESFDLNFNLPFSDYLPETVPIEFFMKVETADLRFYFPETNTSRHVMLAIAENMKIVDRNGVTMDKPFAGLFSDRWRKHTLKEDGWVDLWTTPNVDIKVKYTYFPSPPTGEDSYMHVLSPVATPEAEEQLLIPLRAETSAERKRATQPVVDFDPGGLDADLIEIELEVGPSTVCIYGCLVMNLYHVKENYLGEDQRFTDLSFTGDDSSSFDNVPYSETVPHTSFDMRTHRPLAVRVNAVFNDIQVHLVKNVNADDPPAPCAYVERVAFELDKQYEGTELQVLMSPATLSITDNFKLRPEPHRHVNQGHLALSGLQVRGHAMFSHRGLPLGTETLEYGWLVEVIVGDLTGRLTSSHLQNIVEILQTTLFLVQDSENSLQHPLPYHTCQHGVPAPDCKQTPAFLDLCPSSEDIKYRLTRVSVDCVDLYLAEAGTALNVQVYPVRLSTCNLHGKHNEAGVSVVIPNINLRQFVLSIPINQPYNIQSDCWLEAGGVCLGPLSVDAALALPKPEYRDLQDEFLKWHDERTHRLWFMWPVGTCKGDVSFAGQCGCVGNCCFFGLNRNGPKFFEPSENDFSNSYSTAVYHICVDENNLGYGQSLLQKNQLIFTRIPGPLFLSTPTRNFLLGQKASKSEVNIPVISEGQGLRLVTAPTDMTHQTLFNDDPPSPQSSEHTLDSSSGVKLIDLCDTADGTGGVTGIKRPVVLQLQSPLAGDISHESSDSTLRLSAEVYSRGSLASPHHSLTSQGSSIPSEFLPSGSIPDAYDTDRMLSTPSDAGALQSGNSASGSLPDLVDFNSLPNSKTQKGHTRKSSYEPPKSQPIPIEMQSPANAHASPSSLREYNRLHSHPSLQGSQHSVMSHASSLTSPVLRRISQREGSLISVDSSATFVSAREDMSSDTHSSWSYEGPASHNSSFRGEYPGLNCSGGSGGGSRGSDSLNSSFRADETLTENNARPLWFAVDRDSTMTSAIDHKTIMKEMAEKAESIDVASTPTGSVASFVSAVSSQRTTSRPDVTIAVESDSSDRGLLDEVPTVIEGTTSGVSITREDSFMKPVDIQDIPSAGDYVDLHGQMNQPITKSPLLMSCYTAHMTKLQCSHWSALPPRRHGCQDDHNDDAVPQPSQPQHTDASSSMSWIPQFAYVKEGFTPSLMVNRKEPFSAEPPHLSSPRTADWRSNRFFPDVDRSRVTSHLEISDDVSKTTAIINLKGSVDVMVSPLMLEALQRYVESVTPVLGALHPSSIVDSLHFRCSQSIMAHNQLSTDHSDPDTSHADKGKDSGDLSGRTPSGISAEKDRECKTSRIQFMFSLSRINLCILQASLVEEMVPFGGLDRVQELTCVSVLACCLDDIHAQFLLSNQSYKAIDTTTPTTESSGGIRKRASSGGLARQDTEEEWPETQLEDMVGKLHIGRVHAQLRRLKKNSNFSDNVFLTAIPEYRSKVLFTFRQQDSLVVDRSQTNTAPEEPTKEDSKTGLQQDLEEIAGFIMVEAGLEDITLKAARRDGYGDSKDSEKEETAEKDSGIPKPSEQTNQAFASDATGKNEASKGPKEKEEVKIVIEDQLEDDKLSVRSQAGSMTSGDSADDEASYASRISLHKSGSSFRTDRSGQSPPAASSTDPTKCSFPTDIKNKSSPAKPEVKGDATSLVLEFKKAWFNFAAPPPSKKRKLQFTRHDWNLVSTATPAINAWLNPCHRAIVSAHNLVTRLEYRTNTVMACLMTEGLDIQRVHNFTRSRYNKLTSLSRTLQDDPSCQLLTVLRLYIHFIGIPSIEESVSADSVPQLLTIQKGILALMRQWKTILHMPVETTFKKKKATFVTFQLPNDDSEHGDDDGPSFDDVVDDKISLLKAEGGSMRQTSSFHSIANSARRSHTASMGNAADGSVVNAAADIGWDEGPRHVERQKSHQPTSRLKMKNVASASALAAAESPSKKNAASARSQSFVLPPEGTSGSFNFPLLGGKKEQMPRNESYTSYHSLSQSSDLEGLPVEGGQGASIPGTPLRHSLTRHLSELEKKKRSDEDLYTWMQRQQEYTKLCVHPNLHYIQSNSHDTFSAQAGISTSRTGASEFSQEDSESLRRLTTIPQSGFTIADAQMLFKPLLKSMGLKLGEVKTSALMKKVGCHLSIKILMSSLRIDIVDSEQSRKRNKGKGKAKRTMPKFYINTNLDTPAFHCDTFEVMVAMKDIVNFENDKKSEHEREMKFAFDSLIAKPTTTKVNFVLNIYSINQHVNMSLLRLVHQFVTMIENVNDTRAELKGLTSIDAFRGHRKQDSKGSSTDTGADSISNGQPEFPNLSRSGPETHVHYDSSSTTQPQQVLSAPGLTRKPTPTAQNRPTKLQLANIRNAPKRHPNMYELLSSKSTPEFPAKYNSSPAIDICGDTSSPAVAETTIVEEIKVNTPKCWRTLYVLLDLYSTMPEPKTINKPTPSRLSVIDEEPEKASQTLSDHRLYGTARPRLGLDIEQLERQPLLEPETPLTPSSAPSSFLTRPHATGTVFTQSLLLGERVPLVVFGIVCVKQVRMSAMLSGLKLEADLNNVNASATHRQKIRGVTKRRSEETSVTANVGHTMIALLEGVAPHMQTVVTVNVAASQGLHSGVTRRSRVHNSCLVTVGNVDVDIPQHPGVLHGMVSRSSKRLSSTLQEFIRPPAKSRSADMTDSAGTPSAQASRTTDVGDAQRSSSDQEQAQKQARKEDEEEEEPRPFVIHFKAVMKGLAVGASLLPSLRAQYQIGQVISSGITGKKARFIIDLPTHSLSFSSKVSTPVHLPSSASIELPPIHMHAEYRFMTDTAPGPDHTLADTGLEFRTGNYLHAMAEVGLFEHCLTTDLLNHLVFVQKVFMKEINEVVQKISGVDQPVSIWGEDLQQPPVRPLLYSLHFRLKGIQITATTPTSSAVRLETGVIDLDMSNRVQPVKQDARLSPGRDRLKVFVKLQLELNLALGTLMKNPIFVEADDEFQQLATFATRIDMRNALQDEMIPGSSQDQEALLISLQRPIVSVMPSAFDKAVLVWLNYKNAYEYWTEQRLAQIKDIQAPILQSQVDKVQSAASQALGTLFLQLTVVDLGICLPLGGANSQSLTQASKMPDDSSTPALVLTLERTQISACSCGSLVSKGRFNGFCLRFANDFEVTWDDWKPDRNLEVIMNAMVVPCGTYEVCSRTKDATSREPLSNAKWILNVKWQMEGMDIHLDTNIGKRLSALGDTLTTLGGDEQLNPDTETTKIVEEDEEEEEDEELSIPEIRISEGTPRKFSTIPEGVPDFLFDTTLDPKTRARMIEQEINEQAKTVEDLKTLGASQSTIDAEERKLLEFEKVVFQDFRQDLLKRLKKQSARATVFRDKLGLGRKPAHIRSRSTGGHPGIMRPDSEGRRLTSFNEDSSGAIFDSVVSESESDSSTGHHQRAMSIDVSALTTRGSPPRVKFDSTPSPQSTQSDIVLTGGRPYVAPATHSTPKLPQGPRRASSGRSAPLTDESSTDSESDQETDRPAKLGSPGASVNKLITALEPMVDFEVDVKVNISSGRLVVHPKEPKAEEDAKSSSRKHLPGGSPRSERKKGARKLDSTGRGYGQTLPDNTTVFHLPGIDIKVHYGSRMVPYELRDSPSSSMKRNMDPPPADSGSSTAMAFTGTLVKKGNLYAWISLQELSEEMLISPSLLDFLEQALEPIPVSQLLQSQPKTPVSPEPTEAASTPTAGGLDLDASSVSLGTAGVPYAVFPVDVVVYIRVQPSLIRFTCLPISRVQCLLRFPSFDVVFSTKKADVQSNQLGSEDPLSPPKRGEGVKRMGSTPTQASMFQRTSSSGRARQLSSVQTDPSSGGLSVTACMSDFSLYVFHPYGGKTNIMGGLDSSFNKRPGTLNESLGSPGSDVGRKDSLSLKVEFVKVNISRTRKSLVHSEATKHQDAKAANIVRFSALCDIGSASFNYDMRRLSEILALPKAWYNRTLARRLFLGEETTFMDSESGEEDMSALSIEIPPDPHLHPRKPGKSDVTHKRSSSADDKTSGVAAEMKKQAEDNFRKLTTPVGSAPQSPRMMSPGRVRESLSGISTSPRRYMPPAAHAVYSDSQMHANNRANFARLQNQTATTTASGTRNIIEWETLVLFGVNLSQLDVNVNMSNVMGNTVWRTRELKSQGQLSIDSSGYRNMKITAGLGGSKLEAKGGIVGGYIEIQELNSFLSIKEDPGMQPDHGVGFNLAAIEIKLDYMGSSVLMNRFSTLKVELTDEWGVDAGEKTQPLATTRPAQIFANGVLSWDKFHLMLSRSTTPDLLKMVQKLEEFFSQQLTSSKRALSQFGPLALGSRSKRKNSEESSWISEIRHHRHWQRVLERIAGCKFTNLTFVLPQQGTILGGSMNLHGNNITLACFHGINFRSKSWALFTMEEPSISFSSESQDLVPEEQLNVPGTRFTHIIQQFTFQLGNNMVARREKRHMAYICKLSRGHYMPPPFTNVTDWFRYAFATNEIKDLDSFPTMARMGSAMSPVETEPRRPVSRGKKAESPHDTEVIFMLPLFQVHLNTLHLQSAEEPEEGDPQPVVECSFITEFEDHIFVAMDAEVLLFLHDLVMSYVKEKDKESERFVKPKDMEKKNIANPTTVLKLDYRHFQCNTWVLEPTIRLISWAGNRIEPVGVDYILQKLGFQHARLTVPKWMQRGCMDPLDKLLSILIDKLIVFLKENTDEEDKDNQVKLVLPR